MQDAQTHDERRAELELAGEAPASVTDVAAAGEAEVAEHARRDAVDAEPAGEVVAAVVVVGDELAARPEEDAPADAAEEQAVPVFADAAARGVVAEALEPEADLGFDEAAGEGRAEVCELEAAAEEDVDAERAEAVRAEVFFVDGPARLPAENFGKICFTE